MKPKKDNELNKIDKLIYVMNRLETTEQNPQKIEKYRKIKSKLQLIQKNNEKT